MATAYCYERIPLRFLASLIDIQMRYLVYMRCLWILLVQFRVGVTFYYYHDKITHINGSTYLIALVRGD